MLDIHKIFLTWIECDPFRGYISLMAQTFPGRIIARYDSVPGSTIGSRTNGWNCSCYYRDRASIMSNMLHSTDNSVINRSCFEVNINGIFYSVFEVSVVTTRYVGFTGKSKVIR